MHPLKALHSIVINPSDNPTNSKAVQLKNAPCSIFVVLNGILLLCYVAGNLLILPYLMNTMLQ